jgi:Flp pilus assembly CpaE family ATPase
MGEQHSAPAPLNRQAITSIVDAMRRGGDVVVADLPRAIDDAVAGVIATCDVVLLVTPADVRGVSAAMHVRRRLQVSGGTARVVVRAEPRARLHVKDVVTALGLEHAGTLRTEKGVTAAIDRAQFIPWLRRSGLGRTACSIADDLSETSLRGVA